MLAKDTLVPQTIQPIPEIVFILKCTPGPSTTQPLLVPVLVPKDTLVPSTTEQFPVLVIVPKIAISLTKVSKALHCDLIINNSALISNETKSMVVGDTTTNNQSKTPLPYLLESDSITEINPNPTSPINVYLSVDLPDNEPLHPNFD